MAILLPNMRILENNAAFIGTDQHRELRRIRYQEFIAMEMGQPCQPLV